MQDYKSLRAEVMICDTLVNTQTHTERASDWFILLAQSAELKTGYTGYSAAVEKPRDVCSNFIRAKGHKEEAKLLWT